MNAQAVASQPLNDVQLMLLKLFSRPVTANQLEEIREMLLNYYETELQKELDRVIAEKKITRADFDAVLNIQQRTK